MVKVNIIPIKVVPISDDRVETDVIKNRGGGASLQRLQRQAQSFWDGLHQGGGAWMWEFVSNVTSEPSWLPLALESGTVVLATDGSYDRKKGPHVSGAGWVIACWRSGRVLKGSFSGSQAMQAHTEGNSWAWWPSIPWCFTHVGSTNPQWSQGR